MAAILDHGSDAIAVATPPLIVADAAHAANTAFFEIDQITFLQSDHI